MTDDNPPPFARLTVDEQLVLSIIDEHSRSVVDGVDERLMRYRFATDAGAAGSSLTDALHELQQKGWIVAIDRGLPAYRLAPAGYRMWLAVDATQARKAATASERHGRPSETSMRQAVLSIYAAHHCGSRDHLPADELRRYWASSGRRSAELRHALDLLLRDGYLRVGRFRRTLFRLTPDGYQYLKGRTTPPALMSMAPAARDGDRGASVVADKTLMLVAAGVFAKKEALPPKGLSCGELMYSLEGHELPEFLQFHACELLHRHGYADLDPAGKSTQLTLTDSGVKLARDAGRESVQWITRMKLSDRQRGEAAGS